jgi:hypothetical protein
MLKHFVAILSILVLIFALLVACASPDANAPTVGNLRAGQEVLPPNEIGDTNGIVVMGVLITLSIVVGTLWRRGNWRRRKQE